MSFLSSKAESELLPLLYSVKPLGAFLEKAEQLLGTPIRFCPGGNMYAPMESPSYPHEDTLHVLHYLSGGLDAQRRKMDVFHMFDPQKPVLLAGNNLKPRRILSWVLLGERCLGHISIPELQLPLESVDLEQVEVICRYLALAYAANDMAQDGDARNERSPASSPALSLDLPIFSTPSKARRRTWGDNTVWLFSAWTAPSRWNI